MNKEIEDFYDCLKDLYSDIVRTRTKTISTEDFKNRATSIYEAWKIKVKPLLTSLEIDSNVLDGLDALFGDTYSEATSRVGDVPSLRNTLGELHDAFLNKIIAPLNSGQTTEPTVSIMESASFLGLDTNWSVAVCVLQLQEVAVTLVAEKLKIDLSKTNVEQILNAKIDSKDFSFNQKYEAFRTEVKHRFDVDMPFLTTQFRRMRVKVLHEGYNPEPEEKDSLVSFTIGLLRKLEHMCSKTEDIKNKQKEAKETTNEDLEKIKKDVKELKEKEDMRVSG